MWSGLIHLDHGGREREEPIQVWYGIIAGFNLSDFNRSSLHFSRHLLLLLEPHELLRDGQGHPRQKEADTKFSAKADAEDRLGFLSQVYVLITYLTTSVLYDKEFVDKWWKTKVLRIPFPFLSVCLYINMTCIIPIQILSQSKVCSHLCGNVIATQPLTD